MAKLRKMLGRVEDPQIIALMRQIETQSKVTLTKWAADWARTHALPILAKHMQANGRPADSRPGAALDAADALASGAMKASEAKKIIREAAAVVKFTDNPAAEAAARTVSVAAGVYFTPTNALGMCFYAAAAEAYDTLGVEETPAAYDAFASRTLTAMLESLKVISVENEPDPVKIDWNC